MATLQLLNIDYSRVRKLHGNPDNCIIGLRKGLFKRKMCAIDEQPCLIHCKGKNEKFCRWKNFNEGKPI